MAASGAGTAAALASECRHVCKGEAGGAARNGCGKGVAGGAKIVFEVVFENGAAGGPAAVSKCKCGAAGVGFELKGVFLIRSCRV